MIVFLSNTISSYCTMQVINKMGKTRKQKSVKTVPSSNRKIVVICVMVFNAISDNT